MRYSSTSTESSPEQQLRKRVKRSNTGISTAKKVAYIHHFRKPEVEAARTLYAYKLKPHRPKTPSLLPIKIEVFAYFDVKDRSKWDKYKPTKPDAENWFKEIADVMTQLGFWKDDNQIVDLHIVKYYAEKASIVIRWEELSDGKQGLSNV